MQGSREFPQRPDKKAILPVFPAFIAHRFALCGVFSPNIREAEHREENGNNHESDHAAHDHDN